MVDYVLAPADDAIAEDPAIKTFMSVHRIRLREPWRRDFSQERVRWSRKFNCPTGLGLEEKIWLTIENARFGSVVHLNGRFLVEVRPGAEEAKVEITSRLELHNELDFCNVGDSEQVSPAIPAEVSLEIVDFRA